ncbi:MAG: hypothetical protein R2828_35740 [Saprospiraceae bacterium]
MNIMERSGYVQVAINKKTVLIFMVFLSVLLLKCGGKQGAIIPEYSYANEVNRDKYFADSTFLIDHIGKMIQRKEGPFYPEKFDDSTEIYIDTILYNADQDRLAFFVITKNTNDKLLTKGSRDKSHFDAHFFIGEIFEKSWELKWFKRLNFSRFESYNDISIKMRSWYNNELEKVKGSGGKSLYKYNLNDYRFWDGPLWDSTITHNPSSYITGQAK